MQQERLGRKYEQKSAPPFQKRPAKVLNNISTAERSVRSRVSSVFEAVCRVDLAAYLAWQCLPANLAFQKVAR